CDDLAESAGGQLGGPDLGPQVAEEADQAVVGGECVEDVAPLLAAVDDLDDGPANALAPDVVGGDVVAAGDGPAGVAVVALDGGQQDEPAILVAGGLGPGEHGGEHVVVGQVAAAVVGVVGDEDVAGAELGAHELEGEA